MSFKSTLLAATAAFTLVLSTAAIAGGTIMVEDAYVRSSTKSSSSGAAFMVLMNAGTEDDRLIAARSDVAKRVELHTHVEDANGVMRMIKVEDGMVVPATGSHALKRGGDHVMFMGLNRALEQGEMIEVTLTFEKAGEITVDVMVDQMRKPGETGHKMKHKSGD